jgi:hypothetical protein
MRRAKAQTASKMADVTRSKFWRMPGVLFFQDTLWISFNSFSYLMMR